MSYEQAAATARAKYRLAVVDSQTDRTVVVVGEPSSGTRLLTRIVDACPSIRGRHDPRHGRRTWNTGRVLIVTRDPKARKKSVDARWPNGLKGDWATPDELREAYPDAPVVTYEDIVADTPGVIARLAEWLGVDPWEFTEEIYDANVEEGTRARDRPERLPDGTLA